MARFDHIWTWLDMFKQSPQRGTPAILSQDQNERQLIVTYDHFLSWSISKNQRHGQKAFWWAVWSTLELALRIAVKKCPPQSSTITHRPQPLPAVPSRPPSSSAVFNHLPLLSIAFRYHLLSSAVPCCPPPSFTTSGRPLLGCQD